MSSTGLNLTSLGLNSTSSSSGSGLDVTAVVNQILDAARGPERLWQRQQSGLTAQTNALNSINSSLTALQTAMQALSDVSGIVASKVATSSQTGILTASAQSDAASGVHLITVTSLATTAASYTDALATSDTTFQTGVITLQVGNTSADITVDSTNNTVSGLAKAINGKNLGVTASVITDATGVRLALVSQTTGQPGDLTIAGNTSGLGFHKSVAGQNASLTIDGVPIASATNTVTGALAGVTLNLASSAPGTPVQLSVGPDTAAVNRAVTNFVSAYNTVIRAVNAQFTVPSSTSAAAPLAANSALRALQSSLLSDITYTMTGNNGYQNLASLGIDMANDGTLSVDQASLDGVLTSHFTEFQNFFQTLSTGFGSHFSSDLTSLTSPTQGVLNANLSEIQSQQKTLSDTISTFEDHLAAREQLLIKQYSQVDAMLRQYPLLMQQISSQLNALSQNQK
jgi:flagellar hook-associated protein 2